MHAEFDLPCSCSSELESVWPPCWAQPAQIWTKIRPRTRKSVRWTSNGAEHTAATKKEREHESSLIDTNCHSACHSAWQTEPSTVNRNGRSTKGNSWRLVKTSAPKEESAQEASPWNLCNADFAEMYLAVDRQALATRGMVGRGVARQPSRRFRNTR